MHGLWRHWVREQREKSPLPNAASVVRHRLAPPLPAEPSVLTRCAPSYDYLCSGIPYARIDASSCKNAAISWMCCLSSAAMPCTRVSCGGKGAKLSTDKRKCEEVSSMIVKGFSNSVDIQVRLQAERQGCSYTSARHGRGPALILPLAPAPPAMRATVLRRRLLALSRPPDQPT